MTIIDASSIVSDRRFGGVFLPGAETSVTFLLPPPFQFKRLRIMWVVIDPRFYSLISTTDITHDLCATLYIYNVFSASQ